MTSALNFDTADCQVIGGCDVYTTKAAGADKKLYKNIESTLETQYASLLSFSASLSASQVIAAGSSLNLSRASPFGPLSQISSRRTFAYLIATLNASHPDYDFSHLLRPSDFRREKSLKKVINTIDTTLYNLRPKPSSSFPDEPPHWSNTVSENLPSTPNGSDKWNPLMWRLIDNEMSLKECTVYCYAPEEDPYDGEEGSLWSFNYFFFNKAKKRVCYLYLRGLSIIAEGEKTPLMPKRCASGTWSIPEETRKKRARFWLGDRASDAEWAEEDDDGMGPAEGENIEEADMLDDGDEPQLLEIAGQTGSESPCKGRERSSSSIAGFSEDARRSVRV